MKNETGKFWVHIVIYRLVVERTEESGFNDSSWKWSQEKISSGYGEHCIENMESVYAILHTHGFKAKRTVPSLL